MARKFTGGKWRHQQAHGKHWVQAGRHEVCQLSDIEKGGDTDEAETAANAALVADAPELLAQLASLAEACRETMPMPAPSLKAALRLVRKHLGATAEARP